MSILTNAKDEILRVVRNLKELFGCGTVKHGSSVANTMVLNGGNT